MNLVLLGMPGSGKGTQAKMISGKYGVPHISTGDIFREILSGNDPLAGRIRGIVDSGGLVTDDIVIEVVRQRLSREDCGRGFLLDGFPRNLNQAGIFDADLAARKAEAARVLYLELSPEVTVKRLTARRSCAPCKRDYNVISSPPKTGGICDACGAKLQTRKDDSEETARKRLDVYQKETSPLISYYNDRGRLLRVDADAAVETVFGRICSLLDE